MGTLRKITDWEGIALHFQKLQQSLLLPGTPPEQTAGCSAGWEESLCGKVPQDESAEGTWLQDCFCAGLKSYHCRVKLARRARTWDRGKEEGLREKELLMLKQPFLRGAVRPTTFFGTNQAEEEKLEGEAI